MIINVNSVSAYSPALSVAIKAKEEATPAEAKDKDGESSSVAVNMADVGSQAAKGDGISELSQEMIKQLQEQIEQVQKQLEQQRSQLAAAQASKGSEQARAQQVMAIQQQISGSVTQLASLQAALLSALKGSVDTTA